MKPLSLPLFFHNESTSNAADAGIETHHSDQDLRMVTFFQPPCAIAPYYDEHPKTGDVTELSAIHINGSVFLCPLTTSMVTQIFDHWNRHEIIEGESVQEALKALRFYSDQANEHMKESLKNK